MIKFIITLLDLYGYLLIASVILSWLGPRSSNPVTDFISAATEPVLQPLRKLIPPIANIDFSPFAAFILLQFIIRILSDI